MNSKSYAEKLRDPRWVYFRSEFIASRRREGSSDECDDCGEDTHDSLHVHHRLYRTGREPWEYEFSDLRLLCVDCHDRIHEVERRTQALIRSIEAHEAYEVSDLLNELVEAQEKGLLKVALAWAKNSVRDLNNRGET